MKPAKVSGWHRKGLELFWTWKIRRRRPGRPAVPADVRSLIRAMSRDNPLWGAPRIHGELLKLDIAVGETSVSKYMVRRRKPPSQTWRTFFDNHVKAITLVDFFTVPTIRAITVPRPSKRRTWAGYCDAGSRRPASPLRKGCREIGTLTGKQYASRTCLEGEWEVYRHTAQLEGSSEWRW